ncbi:EamA family transporter [Phycicoccus duodecadis]|uniref:O-acetylserine/cysteine efflux transporter n=1 Tax=Phycicoccus duodecadis TaxID=173053 RepID=A0A2N3YHF8_9MICO|nr:EamA family transporter [Phycicoccus duodecadis]PKW26289.1 O-acetylserine/cysteine efflux transporter [Phycicoccus duodecadis]
MPLRDVLAACLVMVLWGLNFVVIDWGLAGVPPLVFVALRFLVVLLALPFVPRPAAPLGRVLAIGACMSLGQFGLLYTALAVGMPPGLASLVLQLQAVVTVVVAVALLGERPRGVQWAGVAVGLLGLGVVALGRGGQVPLVALLLTVGAACSWALGNVLVRRLRVPGGLGLTVWSALVVPIPLLALSLVVEGPGAIGDAVRHLSLAALLSTLYTAGLASLVGYGIWNRLLERHPASEVAPFTLLVPPVGLLSAWLVRGERLSTTALGGGALLVLGVALVVLGPRLGRPRRPGPGGDDPAGTEPWRAGSVRDRDDPAPAQIR